MTAQPSESDVSAPFAPSPEGAAEDSATRGAINGEMPKTVLYIDDAVSFGGSLVVTSQLIRHLDPLRYRAVVVSEPPESVLNYLFGETATFYRIPRWFNYQRWNQLQSRFPRSAGRLARKLWSYGLTVVRTLVNIPYLVRLASVVRRERVDIIHHSNGHVRPSLMVFGRPLIGTLQGILEDDYNALERRVLAHHSVQIMISQVVRSHFLKAGGPPEIVELLPNPCDPVQIDPEQRARMREHFGVSDTATVFGIVGRVVRWKGQKEFLAAAELVLAAAPDAVAMIVGDAADGRGEYFDAVKQLAAQSDFSDRIIFTGYVEDVSSVYAVLDVAIHASIEPEPFGLVITEAMGHGIPIVAASSGAGPEIVEDGVDGFLADPTDASALATAITRLVQNEEMRREMGARGKEKVFAEYHASAYARRIQALYDQTLSDRS